MMRIQELLRKRLVCIHLQVVDIMMYDVCLVHYCTAGGIGISLGRVTIVPDEMDDIVSEVCTTYPIVLQYA